MNGQPYYDVAFNPFNYYDNNDFTVPINSPSIPSNIQYFAPIYSGYGNLPNTVNVNNNGISNIAANGGQITNINDTPNELSYPFTIGGSSNGFGYPTNEPNLPTNNIATNGGIINNTNENIQNTQNVGGNFEPNYIRNCLNCEQKQTAVRSNINNNKYLTKNTKNTANINNSNTYPGI